MAFLGVKQAMNGLFVTVLRQFSQGKQAPKAHNPTHPLLTYPSYPAPSVATLAHIFPLNMLARAPQDLTLPLHALLAWAQ